VVPVGIGGPIRQSDADNGASGNSMTLLDGPRLAPLSGGLATGLVVFLHGYGANGNDLIDIGRLWAPVLPGTAFVSPHAPQPCAEAPVGHQWFPLAGGDPHLLRQGVLSAAPALDGFLDAELAAHGLSDDSLALVGFSQGTMMALHVGPRRPGQIAGIVGYSGLLTGPEHLAGEFRHRPPVLLVHGDADPVIPVMALHMASRSLSDAGFAVEAHVRPGLQHGIDQEGLAWGARFLRRTLG
jgi:phospholipase/carboxylesterase